MMIECAWRECAWCECASRAGVRVSEVRRYEARTCDETHRSELTLAGLGPCLMAVVHPRLVEAEGVQRAEPLHRAPPRRRAPASHALRGAVSLPRRLHGGEGDGGG
jgi:hypothetical protein